MESIRMDLLNNSEHQTLEAKESFFADTKRLHETGNLEKKSDEAIKGIIKTIVAFSNYLGGDIVIGLNDPQFNYVGIDKTDLLLYSNWDKYKQALGQKIEAETINLVRRPEIIKVTHNNKTFAIIRVQSPDKEIFEEQALVVLKSDKQCYKRENGDTMPILPCDVKKYCLSVLKELQTLESQKEEEIE